MRFFTSFFGIIQPAGALEYTDCISAEGYDSPNECPGYDTKQSDSEVPVMLELWGMQSIRFLPSLPVSSGSIWEGLSMG